MRSRDLEGEAHPGTDPHRAWLPPGTKPQSLAEKGDALILPQSKSQPKLLLSQAPGQGAGETESVPEAQIEPTEAKPYTQFDPERRCGGLEAVEAPHCACKGTHRGIDRIAAAEDIKSKGPVPHPSPLAQRPPVGTGVQGAQARLDAQCEPHGSRSAGTSLEDALEGNVVVCVRGRHQDGEETEGGDHGEAPEEVTRLQRARLEKQAGHPVSSRHGLSANVTSSA